MIGQFIFRIKEENSTSVMDYCQDFSQPFVLFKAKKVLTTNGEFVDYAVNQNNEILEGIWELHKKISTVMLRFLVI